ncbi:MAG: peroxiredoxin [Acetobacter sp.]|nr:peroxiredoxin [Acetobacter sp.]
MRDQTQQHEGQKETELTVGDKAPFFIMAASRGRTISLDSLKGTTFILYFYPRAHTPGCTQEAVDFSHALPEFARRNVQVIGVSRDTVKKLDLFADKYNLMFPLASDIDGHVSIAYGVWVQKKLYGKTSMGVERTTYLIDAQGIIVRVWRKVKVTGHVHAVLHAVTNSVS